MMSLEVFTHVTLPTALLSTELLSCVGLTNFIHSCADFHEIWESRPPGNLRAWPGLYRVCFTINL